MTETLPNNRLRELREAQGLMREHIAVECGVTAATVDNWEKKGIPSKHLKTLSRRFGVSVSYLLCDDLEVAA